MKYVLANTHSSFDWWCRHNDEGIKYRPNDRHILFVHTSSSSGTYRLRGRRYNPVYDEVVKVGHWYRGQYVAEIERDLCMIGGPCVI